VNTLQRRQWTTIVQAQDFLKQHAEVAPRLVFSRQRLDAIAERISKWGNAQDVATGRSYGKAIRRLRLLLRQDHLIPVSRYGRECLRWTAGIERALKVPHARANSATLVLAAERIATAVSPKQRMKLFLEANFPRDFIAQIRAAAKELADCSRQDDTTRRQRIRATLELRRALSEGRRTIATIEALLLPHFRTQPGLARGWRSVARVPRKQGRPKKANAKRGPMPDGGA
jgi:hypothetical protein